MRPSPLARRRHGLGAVLVGICLAAGSVGTAALADTRAGTTVAVDANVLVGAGLSPMSARQAAAGLNSAIDSAAATIARAAVTAIPSARPVRTTATATRAFADQIDAALTQYAVSTVAGLQAAGTPAHHLVNGTLAALGQAIRTIPGAVAVATGAEFAVASGADGTQVTTSLNPVVDLALRTTIGDTVRAIRPVLPLSRATVRAVAAGVRQVVDASVVAVEQVIEASVDFVGAVLNVTGSTLTATDAVASSAVAGLNAVVAAADAALDNLSDVNLTAAVDAGLHVSAS